MAKHNDGQLSDAELEELRILVREVEELSVDNAQVLTGQSQRLASAEVK